MNWGSTILLALLLLAAGLPWHLPDALVSKKKNLPLPGLSAFYGRATTFFRRHLEAKPHLASAVIEVASRLNAGADPTSAWIKTLPRHGFARPKTASTTDLQIAIEPYLTTWEQAALTGLLAALRFSEAVGAPLSEVLSGCADSLTEASRAAQARKLALTAPKASATILGFLPVGGIALGTLLGANPLRSIFAGGLASISALAGLICLCAGMLWMFRLVAQAEKA
ncbi:type II secretion system F family protein [Varibaculum vaginae]|uniref:type II secretion system F family protein n=1 Tax=Varibaculum vaginae TaxID=2364797 RepID=UPI000F084C97|nr:hypothetical protein [Varibaculum vaginae]